MLPNAYTCSQCREQFRFGFREARYYLDADVEPDGGLAAGFHGNDQEATCGVKLVTGEHLACGGVDGWDTRDKLLR